MTLSGAPALVVEDDRATKHAITAHLRHAGFQVLATGSGLTGKAHKPPASSGHGYAHDYQR